MKKRLLSLIITLGGILCSQKANAYSVTDLTNAGWTQVTSVADLHTHRNDSYFILVDAGTSNYAMANPNPGSGQMPAYQTLQDPNYITHEVWTLTTTRSGNRPNYTYTTTIRNYSDNYYFSSGTAGWDDNMVRNAANGYCNFTVTYANNKFTLKSNTTNQYVGPWNNNGAVALTDGYENIAANKSDAQAPDFYIYRKARTDYAPINHTALESLGWTRATASTDLGKAGFRYMLLDLSENGYESGYTVTGATGGRPKSKVLTASTTANPSAAQQWTMATKGGGLTLQNMEDNLYLFCNGATWNTGFTDNWNANSTEFHFTYDADGRWTLSNSIAAAEFGGRWANNANHSFDGEDVAFNKAAAAGKKFYYIYSKPFTSSEKKLYGFLKKARALNSILQKAELTAEIAEAARKLGNSEYTAAQIEDEIAVLQSLWMAEMDATSPMITVNNGTFDTGINIGTDGVNTATFIAPATAAKPYIYPVQGWTPDFTFGNTASQGNTSHYGVTVVNNGDNGTNSTNPPASDMFGGTDGGVLHTSAGWNNISRYYQNLPTLNPGRYILYYEANNQNDNANTIQTSYFGISNATPAKYSTLMTYPYNEWMASATEVIFFDEQSGARLNVGVTGTTGGSANGAKLWVDNVEFYHLKWDETSAAEALQERINNIDKSQYMNETVCQSLVNVIAEAQAIINDNTHTLSQINEAQQAIARALVDAEASIEVYRTIKARLDLFNNAAQRGSITEANFTALPFYQKYSNGSATLTSAGWHVGTYTTLNEVIPQYRTDIAAYWASHAPAVDNDLSAFIVNQGFEFGDITGWELTGEGGNSNVRGDGTTNYNYEKWNGTFSLSQKLTNMPEGRYQLKVQGLYRPGNKDYTVDTQNAYIFGGTLYETELRLVGNATDAPTAQDNDHGFTYLNAHSGRYIPDTQGNASKTLTYGRYEHTLDILVASEGVTIGGKKEVTIGEDWTVLDNFRLIYKGNNAAGLTGPGTPVEEPMRKAASDAQTAAFAAWNAVGGHTISNYVHIWEAYNEAQVSHEAYLAAQRAVTRVEALLNNTNVYTYDAYVKFYDFYNIYKAPFDDRTLADNMAAQMEYQIFGNRTHRQVGVPVVEFLGSAWDHAGDYMWNVAGNWQVGFEYNKDATHNYWVNTWSAEGDNDGSNFKEPFMEYWYADNQTLANNTLTAVVKAVPGSNNTVTAWIRARIADGQTIAAPTGITMRVAPENAAGEIDLTNTVTVTPTWTRIGTTQFYQAHVTLNNGKADYDSDGDGFGDLRIQFVINNTQASWFSFRDVRVDYGSVTVDWDEVDDEIDFADNNVTLGFWGGEYSPYTNIKALKAVEALRTYKEAHEKGDPVNNVLVNSALYTLNGHPGWVVNPGDDWGGANPQEMNAVSWRTNYTRDEIVHAYDYNDDGSIAYDFRTIIPDGWDLNGRSDGYDTRLMKYGVNTGYPGAAADDVGLFANCDSLAMFTKHDTRYGEQIGYTMPLKKGTKYSLTFTYTNWANEAIHEADQFHDNVTYIVVHKKGDSSAAATCPVYWSDDDTPLEYLSHKAEEDVDYGNAHETRWKAVRAYFTTKGIEGDSGNEDYVIEFNKSIKNRQIQMAVGEVYILKYREKTPAGADFYLDINGQNTNTGTAANNYTDNYKIDTSVKACNAKLTRTIKKGQWNSLCLPIKVPYKDMRRLFQVNGQPAVDKVFIYTGTSHSGIYEVLNFTSRQGGIQAGQPVLVKPNIDGNDNISDDVKIIDLELKNYVVKDHSPVTKDPNGIYDFVGVYEVYNVKQYDIYTKHNATTGEDELIKKVTDDKKTWLQPTRAYFKDVSVESGRYDAPGLVKLWGFNLDDVETGIMAVEPDGTMTVTSGNIYDLNGRMVRQNATNLEGLRPGIYVVDGRKVMVR